MNHERSVYIDYSDREFGGKFKYRALHRELACAYKHIRLGRTVLLCWMPHPWQFYAKVSGACLLVCSVALVGTRTREFNWMLHKFDVHSAAGSWNGRLHDQDWLL